MLSQVTAGQTLQIQIWKIDRIVFYARNPRKNDSAVDRMLGVDPVGALSALRFEGLDGVPCLLHSARHEPTDGMLLPAHGAHNLLQRGAILALKHLYNLS